MDKWLPSFYRHTLTLMAVWLLIIHFFNMLIQLDCWIMCRVQGYHIQKPIPGKHVCAIPALGMLPWVCHESGGTGTWGADSGSTRAWPSVRCVRPRVSSSVSCDYWAVDKPSAVHSKAASASQAASGCQSTSVVPQLFWVSLCIIALWQSRSLLIIIIYVVFWKLSSIVLCLVT